ncbi:hypothetical protein [Glycomyces sp. NPDC047010]|uniref:hypothetical protein n=1 Tax=Glycomyces sp. NPDC047010 TaxID=3155023 RepID=UPI0033D87F04
MRLRRAVVSVLAALLGAVASLAVVSPAQAVPESCTDRGYTNGRIARTDNDDNGGGAYVLADLCWKPLGNGYYSTYVYYFVQDTEANGAGAAIRMEWTGIDGETHYDVADPRAWANGEYAWGPWSKSNIKGLYVRACLTNAGSEGHHCGPKS